MKKIFKALVLDVDGTLINRSLEISPRVKKAILKIKKKVSVSLCSGRTYDGYEKYVDQLGLTALQVGDAGAVIVDPKTDKIVYEKFIDSTVSQKIIGGLKNDLNWPFLVSINKKYYFDVQQRKKIEVAFGHKILPSHIQEMERIDKLEVVHTPKITLMGIKSENDYNLIEKFLSPFVRDIHIVRSVTGFAGGGSADITEHSVTKLSGLKKLSELTGISLDETIVVGDGYNDFPLLMAGGLRVAMGNAVPDLKKIADYVTASVDDDGVAEVIENFLMK